MWRGVCWSSKRLHVRSSSRLEKCGSEGRDCSLRSSMFLALNPTRKSNKILSGNYYRYAIESGQVCVKDHDFFLAYNLLSSLMIWISTEKREKIKAGSSFKKKELGSLSLDLLFLNTCTSKQCFAKVAPFGGIFCHPSLFGIDDMRDAQSALSGKEEPASRCLELSHSPARMKTFQQPWILRIRLRFPHIRRLAQTEALGNAADI